MGEGEKSSFISLVNEELSDITMLSLCYDQVMDLKELFISVHKALQDAHIEHALIGAFAMAHYGVQRATGDIDFLIDEEDRDQAISSLEKLGFKIFYQADEVLQLEGPGSVDFLLAKRPMSRKMLQEAAVLDPLKIKCVSIEGIIGLKIQAYHNDAKRELRDKADILSMIEKNREINWEVVKQYADLFNAWGDILKLKREAEND